MNLLNETLVYLLAAVVAVSLSRRLGLGSVLGYLAAGIIIGPFGLSFIEDADQILHFAELGIVFLLFIVGLELKPSRLWVMRRMVFGLGAMQVIVSTIAIAFVAYLFGFTRNEAIVTGLVLGLSSTAFVLQMLVEKKELASSHGRAAFSILLFQDLAAIPMIAILPLLGANASFVDGVNFTQLGVMAATIGGLIVAGRYGLTPAFKIAARSGIPEIFTAATLLVVIGSALLMQVAGMSMVLGAFIAGMMLAESEFRHQLVADIAPFKGLLLGLFFIAVGMSVNLGLLMEIPLRILVIVVLLMSTKGLVLYLLAKRFGMCDRAAAIKLAAVLAQGGEFAFVLLTIAASELVLPAGTIDELILAVAISMLLTPLAYLAAEVVSRKIKPAQKQVFDAPTDEGNEVLIAGFGRVGQIVGRLLTLSGKSFTALESDSAQVEVVRRYGATVHYGDAMRPELLRAAGAEHAKIFVLAVSDMDESIKIAESVQRNFPHLKIIARARNRRHAYRLMDLGVEHIFRETLLSSLAMSEQVLRQMGRDEADARQIIETFRTNDEQLLKEQHAVHDSEEKLLQTTKDAARELESLLHRDTPITK